MIDQARNLSSKLGEAVDAVKARSIGVESELRLDGVLLFAALGLLSLGLVMVSSASIALGDKLGSPFHYAMRQGIFALAGLGLAAVVLWRTDLQWVEKQR